MSNLKLVKRHSTQQYILTASARCCKRESNVMSPKLQTSPRPFKTSPSVHNTHAEDET